MLSASVVFTSSHGSPRLGCVGTPLVASLGLLRWQRAEQGRRGGLGVMLAHVHGHSLEEREKKGWIRKMWVPSCHLLYANILSESDFR